MKNYINYINERLGINDDVILLSDKLLDIIINMNMKKQNKLILNNLNIRYNDIRFDNIEIEILNRNSSAAMLSKNNIRTVYLTINENSIKDKTLEKDIYHEVNHILQFSKFYDKSQVLKSLSIKSNTQNQSLETLYYLIYYSSETEINSKITEIYSLIKDLKNIENEKIKKETFNNIISEYLDIAKIMMSIDLKLNNCNTKCIKDMSNLADKYNLLKIKELDFIFFKFKYKKNLTEKETVKMVNMLLKHVKKQGKKLYKKIGKLYGLI